MSKFFSTKDLKGVTVKASSLSQSQRGVVRDALGKLKAGGIGKNELKRTMRDLRDSHQISKVDRKAIERAMFEDKE